jgi:hypothetical protein
MPPRVSLVRASALLCVVLFCAPTFAKPKAKTAVAHPPRSTKTTAEKSNKTPAYQVKGLPFLTHLKADEGKAVECKTATCNESRGTVVLRGLTDKSHGNIAITIREHRLVKGAAADQLLALTQGLTKPKDEVRVVSGTAGSTDASALEQWTVTAGCRGVVTGRVLVALPDKIIELETAADAHQKHVSTLRLAKDMSAILGAIRVRRLGDQKLTPGSTERSGDEKLSVEDLAKSIAGSGCSTATK